MWAWGEHAKLHTNSNPSPDPGAARQKKLTAPLHHYVALLKWMYLKFNKHCTTQLNYFDTGWNFVTLNTNSLSSDATISKTRTYPLTQTYQHFCVTFAPNAHHPDSCCMPE